MLLQPASQGRAVPPARVPHACSGAGSRRPMCVRRAPKLDARQPAEPTGGTGEGVFSSRSNKAPAPRSEEPTAPEPPGAGGPVAPLQHGRWKLMGAMTSPAV